MLRIFVIFVYSRKQTQQSKLSMVEYKRNMTTALNNISLKNGKIFFVKLFRDTVTWSNLQSFQITQQITKLFLANFYSLSRIQFQENKLVILFLIKMRCRRKPIECYQWRNDWQLCDNNVLYMALDFRFNSIEKAI